MDTSYKRCGRGTCRHQPPAEVTLAGSGGPARRAAFASHASAAARSAARTCRPTSSSSRSICSCASRTSKGSSARSRRTMVEESESHTCGVWLIDEERSALRAVDGVRRGSAVHAAQRRLWRHRRSVPVREPRRAHLFAYKPGWTQTDRVRRATMRGCRRRFARSACGWASARIIATPLRARRPHARLDDGCRAQATPELRGPLVARRAHRSRSRGRRRSRCTTAG